MRLSTASYCIYSYVQVEMGVVKLMIKANTS